MIYQRWIQSGLPCLLLSVIWLEQNLQFLYEYCASLEIQKRWNSIVALFCFLVGLRHLTLMHVSLSESSPDSLVAVFGFWGFYLWHVLVTWAMIGLTILFHNIIGRIVSIILITEVHWYAMRFREAKFLSPSTGHWRWNSLSCCNVFPRYCVPPSCKPIAIILPLLQHAQMPQQHTEPNFQE